MSDLDEPTNSLLTKAFIILKRNSVLIALGLGLESEFLGWLFVTGTSMWAVLTPLFFALFATYVVTLIYVKRSLRGNSALMAIAVFAIAFRLTLLFSGPILSTDILRYYWEGKVVANGFNPYLYPPDAPQLASLRDPVWGFLNLKFLPASYPPLLELFFAFVYLIFRSVFGYKVVFFIFDLALIGMICLVLRELNLDAKNVIVYAWAPLPIIEVAQSGHNDPMVVFLLFVFFLLFLRAKNVLSAHVLGLSVVSKFYPIFLFPYVFKRWGKRATTIFLATVVVVYAPLLTMGLSLFNGLLFAINTVDFNGSIFPTFVWLMTMMGVFANPGFAAQVLTYVVYLGILLWAFYFSRHRMKQRSDVMKLSLILIGSLLLLNRAFFPWYVIWIVPFLAFFTSPSWLLLSGTIFMGYMKYNSFPPPSYEAADPQTRLLIDLIQYVPFYIILAFELFKSYRRSPRGRQSQENRSTGFEHLLDS